MASNVELYLIEQFLKLKEIKVIDYRIIEDIGIFVSLKNTKKRTICPRCGKTTEFSLHQNNFITVRDLPFGEQQVYLKVNRRLLRCNSCQKKFSEDLGFVRKRRRYTKRFVKNIIEEVLHSDIKNVAKRNELSEQEIETMLKDLGQDLVKEKPVNLNKLGIDEIAVVKGQKNYYVVLVDLEKRKIIGLIEKRRTKEILEYLEAWGEGVLSQIKEVSIDLWKSYKSIAKKLMPQAKIVADRFHIMKQVNDELADAPPRRFPPSLARTKQMQLEEKLKEKRKRLKINQKKRLS
ncbi:MAG: ISL3 family transposase [Prochloraceae cyanobacterium]|nr:ISL3 family transposase [Prochloraceae cyanobacterium]